MVEFWRLTAECGSEILGLCFTAGITLTVIVVVIAAPDRLPALVDGRRFKGLNTLASCLGVVLLFASICHRPVRDWRTKPFVSLANLASTRALSLNRATEARRLAGAVSRPN